mgnify:FL=1
MERKDAIRSAYRMTGSNSFYDGMITCSTPSGKAVCRLVWDMNKAECDDYLEKALSGIPEGFSGKLLEVPVGTGILTMPVYKTLPDTDIVNGIDYSEVSVERAQKLNRSAIACGCCEVQQGDVSELGFKDAQFDLVTAFETVYFWPGLPRCFGEVFRVLRPGGTFFICNECSGDTGKDVKWTEMIDGMTIYRDSQLRETLEQSGFHDVRIHKNNKGWLCVTAKK